MVDDVVVGGAVDCCLVVIVLYVEVAAPDT